jgi:hypothetical protein
MGCCCVLPSLGLEGRALRVVMLTTLLIGIQWCSVNVKHIPEAQEREVKEVSLWWIS